MVQTIGNPASWAARLVTQIGHVLGDIGHSLGSKNQSVPKVRAIEFGDIRLALRMGMEDLVRFRSDVVTIVVIYPVIGLMLAFLAFERALLPMLFPMAAGFALLGPVAAIGLYELSRQYAEGEDPTWATALGALRSRTIGPVVVLASFLLMLFLLWMASAFMIFNATLGPAMPESTTVFMRDVLTTWPGWQMIMIGMGVGFVFAALVLVTAAFSFPMLIDRSVGIPVAVATSIAVARKNPVTMASWGLTVAVLLALGSIPFFLGLIAVMPILGHATWHLYTMVVTDDS